MKTKTKTTPPATTINEIVSCTSCLTTWVKRHSTTLNEIDPALLKGTILLLRREEMLDDEFEKESFDG